MGHVQRSEGGGGRRRGRGTGGDANLLGQMEVITIEDDSDDELLAQGIRNTQAEGQGRRASGVSEIVVLGSSDEEEVEELGPRERNRRRSSEEASRRIRELARIERRSDPPIPEVIQLFDRISDCSSDVGDVNGNLSEEEVEDIERHSEPEDEVGELSQESLATDHDDEILSVTSSSSSSPSSSPSPSLSSSPSSSPSPSLSSSPSSSPSPSLSSSPSSASAVQGNLDEDDIFPGDSEDEISTIVSVSSSAPPVQNSLDNDSVVGESDNEVMATFNEGTSPSSRNEDEVLSQASTSVIMEDFDTMGLDRFEFDSDVTRDFIWMDMDDDDDDETGMDPPSPSSRQCTPASASVTASQIPSPVHDTNSVEISTITSEENATTSVEGLTFRDQAISLDDSTKEDGGTSVEDPISTSDEEQDISMGDTVSTSTSGIGPPPSSKYQILQLPVDPLRETRIVYYPKPDFSALTKAEKRALMNALVRRANFLHRFEKLGSKYQREFPKLPPPKSKSHPFLRNILKEDEDGIIRRVFFRPTRFRDDDTAAVTAGVCTFKLPPNATPSYLEILSASLPPGAIPDRLLLNRCPSRAFSVDQPKVSELKEGLRNVSRPGRQPSQQANYHRTEKVFDNSQRGATGPTTTATMAEAAYHQALEDLRNNKFVRFGVYLKLTKERKDEIMKRNGELITKALADVVNRQKEEKEAERQAKIMKRAAAAEARKAERAAALAALEESDQKRTRLGNGVIPRTDYSILRALNLCPTAETTSQKPDGPNRTLPSGGNGGRISDASEKKQTVVQSVPTSQNTRVPPPLKTRKRKRSAHFCTRRSKKASRLKGSAGAPLQPSIPASRANPISNAPRERCPLENNIGWVGGDNWEVEKIIDVRIELDDSGKPSMMYKIKWRGWASRHNSWVDENDFTGTQTALNAFWKRHSKSTNELNLPIRRLAALVEPEPSDFYSVEF